MALDSDLVRVAVTGAVSVGATTTAAPTSASSTLNTDEVQSVTITGTPTGGTFTLTYSAQTTASIAYNASAATVQTSLRALSNIGPNDVVVTGAVGGPYTVTFAASLDGTNVAAMTATASLTGGTTPGVTIATVTEGVAGFADLGYVGEDGVKEARERSTTDIKGWQNGAVLRTVVTDGKMTFEFTMVETNQRTVETFYGAAVVTLGIVIVPTSTGGRKSFVIDVVDGAELCRIYIPQGEVTEVGEVTYAGGEPIGYPVTITAYPDATLAGSAKKWYSALAA